MSKTLYLPLEKKWYNMIERGEKTEEYREIKQHWIKQICDTRKQDPVFANKECKFRNCEACFLITISDNLSDDCYQYDAVRFSYGYTRRTMTFDVESITIGKGKPEWGAPAEDVFIIKLGRRLA